MPDDKPEIEEEDEGEWGEEEEEEGELGEEEHVEEESILSEYDPDDFISGAVTSPTSSIPVNFLDFEYSFGYNCRKFFNLCACDDMVVCYSSGSMITFLDTRTKQMWFRRSTTGGTVGSITSFRQDPNYRIVIAEDREGEHDPLIVMYTWPQMEIDAVLRDGTANAYSILDFSPDGELLASVGKEPDYNLTIWNWKKHKILLRTSAFTFDVNTVMFSPYCEGQLTTAGAAHIKFWKMAHTFTGLKLKGELGRFGKTEICDVLGVYPMPDEKVLSGCEWGNILVWEAGLVKVEVTQKGRKFCHSAPIIQFMLSPKYDEVTTISRDGCIRAWYWETVDQADPPEEDPYVELNPVAETCVTYHNLIADKTEINDELESKGYSSLESPGTGPALPRRSASTRCPQVVHEWTPRYHQLTSHGQPEDRAWSPSGPRLVTEWTSCGHRVANQWTSDSQEKEIAEPTNFRVVCQQLAAGLHVPGCQIMCLKHKKDMYWYAQDGNGGIWTVDSEIDKLECEHEKIMTCHAGAVIGVVALRTHPILVTAGTDGTLQAYDTTTYKLLARYIFPTSVTCMFYPPSDVDETSCILIVGFGDGIMRTLLLHPDRLEARTSMADVRVHSTLTIHSENSESPDVMDMISLLKPHSKAITQITINELRTLLVTCGEDSTIFLYKLKLCTPFELWKIGYIETPNNIAFMTFKPKEELVLLLCGQAGLIMETLLPEPIVRKYTEITTFKLDFKSYKETLVKKHFMRHRPFPEDEDLASIDEEALKAKEEAEQDDDEDEEWIGEIELIEYENVLGTTITWAEYCDDGIWIVQQGTGALILIHPGNNKIIKYAPIPGAWSENLTRLKFICENRYLIFGTNTGIIRVVRMPTEEEDNPDRHLEVWTTSIQKLLKKLKGRRLAKEEKQPIPRIDFVDFYYLPMHDRYTGSITGLEFSNDSMRLYSSGMDGNIFAFKVNFPEILLPELEIPLPPGSLKISRVKEPSTVEGELMSHEQLKQKEEFDKMMAIANAHKKRVRDQLADLTTEYAKLIKANRALPFSQHIDETLDPRPLEVQEKELEDAKALTVRKLAHQLEASNLGLHKMHSRNIVMLDVFPFTLRAISDPRLTLRPLRQKNLSKDFYAQMEEVYQMMAEAALRGRHTESTARRVGVRKASIGPPRIASFLLGLPPKPPYPLKKALRNYHVRLNRHHVQLLEWQEHLNLKPDPNAMPPGAGEALKEAEATIGNRILKTQPDYVAPAGHNTQIRICLVRKEIYDLKHEFNKKVVELRERKVQMYDYLKEIGERMLEIRYEIPANLVKPPPPLPQFHEDLEFPERHLEVKPEPIQMGGSRSLTSKKSQALQDRKKLSGMSQKPRVRQPRFPRFVPINESRPLGASWELLKSRQDQESSPIENEVRERRIERHIYEQDILLKDAMRAVQKFDARLKELQRERIRVQEKDQLLQLHLYQLHREMNVLNRFEMHEDRLAERVYSKLMQVRGVQEQISDCEHRIEEHYTEKEELEEKCQEIQRQFKRLVQENKFADFLRRIFKKKYRPPRVRDDDEESESESSSSSSEEEDEESLDSRDIGPIRLDPNICPEGCEREIFDMTYQMRNTRHKYEQDIIEQGRLVELLKRDIEAHNKIKRKLSVQLETRKNNLREFMLEKQSNMNEVDTVVVLRYDQIRASAINDCTGPLGLSQTVVFPEAMLTRLRKRVLELQEEIMQQRNRQKINRTHLFRMNVDMRAMEAEAQELRAQMRDVLTRKLGKPRKVDRTLDDLLRQMARRHKYAVTYCTLPHVVTQLRTWSERHSTLEKKYLAALNLNSERLRLAATLQCDVLPHKVCTGPGPMAGGYDEAQYQRDVTRLLILRQRQQQQIQQLREEINSLRSKPLSELSPMPSSARFAEPAESDISLFMVPRTIVPNQVKYFPTSPLASETAIKKEVTVTTLLFDCLDAMRITRDDAEILLSDVVEMLPEVMTGELSRFELVDNTVRKWLVRYGGNPNRYKKQTRAFDALAALANRLIEQQMDLMESSKASNDLTDGLEDALRDMSNEHDTIEDRLGPAIAALLHSARGIGDTETMTSLVRSLIDESHPITLNTLGRISVFNVLEDIKDCGVDLPTEEIEQIIITAIDAIKAQILEQDEIAEIDQEVEDVMKSMDCEMMSTVSFAKNVNSSKPTCEHKAQDVVIRDTSKGDLTTLSEHSTTSSSNNSERTYTKT